MLVDNDDSGFVVESGHWNASTGISGFHDVIYAWNAAGSGDDKVRWELTVDDPDVYEVFAWWVERYDRVTDAHYTIDTDFHSENRGSDIGSTSLPLIKPEISFRYLTLSP